MYLRNVILAALALATVVFGQATTNTFIAVDVPYQVRYAVNTGTAYDAYFDIANDGASGASQYGSGLGSATTGNICANVYAFDQAEEMISCCSCLVTPDETVGLSLQKDILSNPLTTVSVTSVTIKLVATLAGSGTSCGQSAANIGTATLANGMLAWGMTWHNQNESVAAGTAPASVGETPFSPATLSASESASLITKCASIIGNGSGPGQCKSCPAGTALGASFLGN